MGDAGPPTPPPSLSTRNETLSKAGTQDGRRLKEITVLVTGFGPFKSFLVNPSWLIASALPDELFPSTAAASSPAYRIKVVVYPSAVRVSYKIVAALLPQLIDQHDPDFILHIGMAGGRDCYSLETRAHRDGYRIKDVDDSNGTGCGETVWKQTGVPDVLYVGWDEADVLARWEQGVEQGLRKHGVADLTELATLPPPPSRGIGVSMSLMWGSGASAARAEELQKKTVVKLSRDAGKYLCEYALFASLSRLWLDAHAQADPGSEAESPAGTPSRSESEGDSDESDAHKRSRALVREGRVAFLHVPGWTSAEDVQRGVMVAEEAIRALVDSWEAGFRRHDGGAVGTGLESRGFTTQRSEAHEAGGVPRRPLSFA